MDGHFDNPGLCFQSTFTGAKYHPTGKEPRTPKGEVCVCVCVCVSERERELCVNFGRVCLSVYVCAWVHASIYVCYECGHHSCARHAQAHTMAGSGTVSPLPTNLQIANFQRCERAFHQPPVRVKLQLALHLLSLRILQLHHLLPPVSSSSLPVHSVPAPVCQL